MLSLSGKACIATFRATCQFQNRLVLKMVESDGSWAEELEVGLAAAPVSAFPHAPLSPGWQVMQPGLVVEILHSASSSSAWLATVVRMAGYQVLETCLQCAPELYDRLGVNGMLVVLIGGVDVDTNWYLV